MVIYGLGNFGEKYQKNRHNIGARTIKAFCKKNGLEFEYDKKSRALMCFSPEYGIIGIPGKEVLMNISGGTVSILLDYDLKNYKSSGVIETGIKLLIVHDDIDIPIGKIKISKGRGSGGHKGVESIIKKEEEENLGSSINIVRIRIGISPILGKSENVEKFVLNNFTNDEEKIIKEVIDKSILAIEIIKKEGIEKAMGEFNK